MKELRLKSHSPKEMDLHFASMFPFTKSILHVPRALSGGWSSSCLRYNI